MQLDQSLAQCAEGLGDAFEFAGFTTRYRRPDVFDGRDTLARLGQQSRIEQTELDLGVMDRRKSRQAIGLPHGRQQGRVRGVLERGLGAEEQQIEQQTLGYIGLALGQHAVLRQYLRRNPLDMQIYRHQFQAHRIHKGCGDLPKHARTCRRLACRQAGKNFRKCLRGAFVAGANQRKQCWIDLGLGIGAIGQGLRRRRTPWVEPAPAVGP